MSPRFLKPRRILVVANETVTSRALREAIAAEPRGADLLLVAPALNTRARFWTRERLDIPVRHVVAHAREPAAAAA